MTSLILRTEYSQRVHDIEGFCHPQQAIHHNTAEFWKKFHLAATSSRPRNTFHSIRDWGPAKSRTKTGAPGRAQSGRGAQEESLQLATLHSHFPRPQDDEDGGETDEGLRSQNSDKRRGQRMHDAGDREWRTTGANCESPDSGEQLANLSTVRRQRTSRMHRQLFDATC